MWIDSHCHLDHNRFLNLDGPGAIVTRAKEQGVFPRIVEEEAA